jgi:hypothetical protein
VITTKDHNLFNAFFLVAPAVSFAVLFTALVAAFVATFPVTFASAVPKGEGWESFCLLPSLVRESLLEALGRVLDGDALRGWEDVVVDVASFEAVVVDGMVRVGVVVDSIEGCCWGVAFVDFEGPADSDFDGVSNSGGGTCVG